MFHYTYAIKFLLQRCKNSRNHGEEWCNDEITRLINKIKLNKSILPITKNSQKPEWLIVNTY